MADQAFKPIAQRIVNAENEFIETLMERAAISDADAVKAFNTFRKLRVLKLDVGIGRYTVKHGGLMAPDVIRRAVDA